jgi:riboflavin kinase / FMN adenylyltransferase
MRIYGGDPAGWSAVGDANAVAIGVFDGVHRGHQAVFSALAESSDGLPIVAMTFSTHPDAIVRDGEPPLSLTTLERRLELFEAAGVTATAIIDFTDATMRLSPRAFVDTYLVEGLAARLVAVGQGFRFGYEASGTVDTLRVLGGERGFSIVATPIVTVVGTEVRSSTIRSAIASGGVELAARMLGRPFEIDGEVISGDGRGRTIGVPTANVSMPPQFVRPAGGVYAVRCTVDGAVYDGVSNVGTRPTFGGGQEVIEVHLLDVDLDLYGRTIRVAFIDRIRDERRFDGVEALVAQIREDIDRARLVLDA